MRSVSKFAKYLASAAVVAVLAACGGGGGGTATAVDVPVVTPPVVAPQVVTPPVVASPTATTVSLILNHAANVVAQSAQLTWSSTNATSCNASDDWSGSQSTAGSKYVSATIAGQSKFTLTCTGAEGSATQSVSLTTANPALSDAGTWEPVSDSNITATFKGSLANTFHGVIQLDNSGKYGMAVTGWAFSGWPPTLTTPAPVSVGLFSADSNGNLKINTSTYISDPVTNGGGSMIIADFNGDGRSDIFLAAHNESPFVAMPSTAYLSTSAGIFTKVTLTDHVMAHDAELAYINDAPVVITRTFGPGDQNSIYRFQNGAFVQSTPMNFGNSMVGGMDAALAKFGPNGQMAVATGDSGTTWSSAAGWDVQNINIYMFDGLDISSTTPIQSIVPYLSTLPQYKDILSLSGKGLTHTYRVWADDLNNDGKTDILAGESMWSETSKNFPSALQVLINKGDGTFKDMTANLNADMNLNTSEMDYAPTFVDIDHSGIKTYLFAGSTSWGDPTRQADYVLLNDGTGRLYIGLHSIFNQLASQVYSYLNMQFNASSTPPRFIGIPQIDGSINFIAEIATSASVKATTFSKQVFKYVNVPLHYNPATDFTQDVTVSDRNGSKLMRTWGGNDTFYDTNAAATARIDGGLGNNRCVYSGKSTDYQINHNTDNSYTISTQGSATVSALTDTLIHIQTLQFSDKSVTLN